MQQETMTVGDLLRRWRQTRRLSQLTLSSDAGISQRHLSFLESGRSRPSPGMAMRLGELLDMPLRERNALLVAAGHAPRYPERPLDAPEFSAALAVIERILDGHLPHPALAVNRHWELLFANRAVYTLLEDVAPHLLQAPVNVLRLSLHPEGLAPRILNLGEWRAHILARLGHEIAETADPALGALRKELEGLCTPPRSASLPPDPTGSGRIAIPLRLSSSLGPLSFLSTTTVFGTAVDVTLSEVTLEAFFPADAATAEAMTRSGHRA